MREQAADRAAVQAIPVTVDKRRQRKPPAFRRGADRLYCAKNMKMLIATTKAGDGAHILLMAFLQNYNDRNRNGKQQKDDPKDNLDSWHKAPP